jgi:hypothetical protein
MMEEMVASIGIEPDNEEKLLKHILWHLHLCCCYSLIQLVPTKPMQISRHVLMMTLRGASSYFKQL